MFVVAGVKSESWGRWLRDARDAKGWTLEELAEKIGGTIVEQTVSKWEHGTIPSAHVLGKLCDVLEVSQEEIVEAIRVDLPPAAPRRRGPRPRG